jgi:hypothetical protein
MVDAKLVPDPDTIVDELMTELDTLAGLQAAR